MVRHACRLLLLDISYMQYTCTHLVNEIGNEEYKGEDASDECTYPDVLWLSTGVLSDDGFGSWTPVPVSTLNNAAGWERERGYEYTCRYSTGTYYSFLLMHIWALKHKLASQ